MTRVHVTADKSGEVDGLIGHLRRSLVTASVQPRQWSGVGLTSPLWLAGTPVSVPSVVEAPAISRRGFVLVLVVSLGLCVLYPRVGLSVVRSIRSEGCLHKAANDQPRRDFAAS